MWSKAGYNEYDFMQMKQDAINQAKEMQHRASPATSSVHPSTGGWQNAQQQVPPPASAKEVEHCPNCGSPIIDGKHVNPSNEQPKTGRGRGRPAGSSRQNINHAQNPVSAAANRPSAGRRNTNTRQANSATQPKKEPVYEAPYAETIGASPHSPEQETPPKENSAIPSFGKINIPILGDIDLDRDILVIGGLLLVLITEEGDRMLMLALLYIMMG